MRDTCMPQNFLFLNLLRLLGVDKYLFDTYYIHKTIISCYRVLIIFERQSITEDVYR